MNILYDHAIFARQQHGGISRYFSELIPRMAALPDTHVSLFMGLHINDYDLPAHRSTYSRFFGVKRWPRSRTYRLTQKVNRALLRWYARKPVDIFHQTAYHPFRVRHAKHVITIHDFIPERFGTIASPGDLFNYKREAIFKADGIICVSEHTKRDMYDLYGKPPGRVAVVYHANSLRHTPTPEAPYDFPYFLFVGSRGGYKDFITLLKTYTTANSANWPRLLCCGGGTFTPTEKQMIAESGLGTQIIWTSADDARLATLYTHATAFIYPSLYEGFGIPLLEAMYYGCPVIASRSSCFPEVADQAALYFSPGSVDDLARTIDTFLTNHALKQQLITAGHLRIKEFSWDRAASETKAFYDAIS